MLPEPAAQKLPGALRSEPCRSLHSPAQLRVSGRVTPRPLGTADRCDPGQAAAGATPSAQCALIEDHPLRRRVKC